MNTKKKNKKPNKPVNTNLPPKPDNTIDKGEQTSEEKIETTKSEERVPEIISEVLPLPVEVKTIESDAPKKPKRNRNKKKKDNKEDNHDDDLEQKVQQPVIEENKVINEEKVKVEKSCEIENITPAVRKKKNKNKKNIEQAATEQSIIKNNDKDISVTADDTSKKVEIEQNIDKENLSPAATGIAEREVKSTKKKNKKKKRNDSEISEKDDETIDCTAAFQKILEPNDEKKVSQIEKKSVNKEEDSNSNLKTYEKTVAGDKNTENESINTMIPELLKDNGKNKKKGKKDKKHSPKVEIEEEIKETSGVDVSVKEEIKMEPSNIPEESGKVLVVEGTLQITDEKPKSKPIIAKPVERKPKEKIETVIAETLKGDVNTEIMSVEKDLPSVAPTDDVIELKDPINVDMGSVIKTETNLCKKEDMLNVLQQVEGIQIPETGMGKKRRKSPKSPTKLIEECQEKQMNITVSESFESSTHDISSSEIKNMEVDIGSSCQKLGDGIQEQSLKDLLSSPEVTEPAISVLELEITESQKDSPNNKPEGQKSENQPETENVKGKRNKKSSKSIKKSQNADTTKNIDKIEKNVETEIKDDTRKDKRSETISPIEDIEIRSLAAGESDSSAYDVVPDIQYPRASSTQPLDDNNNMIIQDITTVPDDPKLNIPLNLTATPLVTDSGETPTPELLPSGMKVPELAANIISPLVIPAEKTDLKSKMMEVNEDMEGLRLSIEKSLAELTAIEKSEEKIEKEFVEAHATEAKNDEFNIKHEMPNVDQKLVSEILKPEKSADVEEIKIESKSYPEIDINPITNVEPKCVEKSIEPPVLTQTLPTAPVNPPRKDNKGKGKGKKKGRQEAECVQATVLTTSSGSSAVTSSSSSTNNTTQKTKTEEKTEQKTETQEKGKQQTSSYEEDNNVVIDPANNAAVDFDEIIANDLLKTEFEPIENFEDALTSSADDVNKTFEMIANNSNDDISLQSSMMTQSNPEISVTAPTEEEEKLDGQEKVNPVSQPKNLLGHPNIPARLNKTDYKKEKNKTPNTIHAKVKIKDAVPIEDKKSKGSQTENKRKLLKDGKSMNSKGTITRITNEEDEEYVYKYNFRKVFLPSACHVCKKDLKQARVPCNFCNLVFYCSSKHKDEDYSQHQALCFAVNTIIHLKEQKHIYAECKNITGQDYRVLRMQTIVSCEKVLKRKLAPWEQEALLYPRICADSACREWRQEKLIDCESCGQIAYCSEHPDHLPKSHQRWCKSYLLYQKLVCYQQTRGRLEPKLPTRVMAELYQMPGKMNEVLASMYEEKIDMNDIQYAALTQVATAPLTAAYCHQLYINKMNSTYANGTLKGSSFTIHMVGAELQFEADALNKWEVFFLHLRPDLRELRVVLIGPELNPSNLPLELLGKIKHCENCVQNKRRVVFDFQDKKTYHDYWTTDFITPDLVCAFNPSIQRSSIYNGKDTWPTTIKYILKIRVPFVVTSYTLNELQRDLDRVKECSEVEVNTIADPTYNSFASVRPDRNFISDDEMPLMFKNHCYMVVCGAF